MSLRGRKCRVRTVLVTVDADGTVEADAGTRSDARMLVRLDRDVVIKRGTRVLASPREVTSR